MWRDVENMGFDDVTIAKANEIYSKATNDRTLRGKSRRMVVIACAYYAYKVLGNHKDPKELLDVYGMNESDSFKGFKIVTVNVPR